MASLKYTLSNTIKKPVRYKSPLPLQGSILCSMLINRVIRVTALAFCFSGEILGASPAADSALARFEPCRQPSGPQSICDRLTPFALWLDGLGKNPGQILNALEERASTLESPKYYAIAPSTLYTAGNGPVLLTVFIQGECSLCKRMSCELYTEATTGLLKGKARLQLKPFTSGIADRALFAAHDQDKFWPYLALLRENTERTDSTIVLALARKAGLDLPRFRRAMESDRCTRLLTRSAAEGKRVGVTVTPTYFVDGYRYRSYKDTRWVVDAVLYRHDHVVTTSSPLPRN